MSRFDSVCLCAIVGLSALISAALFHPIPVLADSGTLTMETPLLESPDPAASVIALLPEGTTVAIDGPPVDGFYPVIVENLSGWMRGETLALEKDTPESVTAEEAESDPLLDSADETVAVEDPAALDPTTDPSAAPEDAPPVAASAPVDDSAPVDASTPDGAGGGPSPSELDSSGAPVAVASDGESPPPDPASGASELAAEPPVDPNLTPMAAAEIPPVGSAVVIADAPILLGPGPEYGLITTAPAGSTVEQTGHVINGYATVQHAELTGWVALEHLGPPGTLADDTPPAETALVETPPVDPPPTDAPPAETPPTETVSSEPPLAETAPFEPPPAATSSAEAAPVETIPIDAAPPGAPA